MNPNYNRDPTVEAENPPTVYDAFVPFSETMEKHAEWVWEYVKESGFG